MRRSKGVKRSVRKNVKKNTRRNQRRVNRRSSNKRVSRRRNVKNVKRKSRRRTGHNKRNKTNKRIMGGGLGDVFRKCVGRPDPRDVKVKQQESSPSRGVRENRILSGGLMLNRNIELAQETLTEMTEYLGELLKSASENPTETQQKLLEEATQMVEHAEMDVDIAEMEYRNYIKLMENADEE